MNSQEKMNLLRQILTFGGAILTGHGIATASQMSQAVTDISTILPAVVSLGSIAWSIYAHWNMKKVPEAAKVGAALVLFCVVLAFAPGAYAADLPVKAVPYTNVNPFLNSTGSGWYFGFGSTASVQQSSVSGNNVFANSLVTGNLNAAGGTIDGVVGYIWSTPNFWGRIEASGSYQNITAGTAAGGGASLASRWAASQEFDVGLNLFQTLLQPVLNASGLNIAFPTFTPSLPANVSVAASPRQYVGAGLREVGIDGYIGAASGSTVAIEPMIKSGYLWQTLGSNGKPNGGAIDVFAWVAFPVKGFTLDNAFSAGGAPLTLGPAADLGTAYGLGLHADIGL